MPDYQATLKCPVTAERAYKAITQEMSGWWTPMSAPFLKIGDRARTGFGGESYWVFEARTLDSPHLIELTCCESRMMSDALKDPAEWEGTTLRFEISGQGNATTITFTHAGLTPEMECYEICKGGWDHYIPGSLKSYLEGEGGNPNTY